MANTTELYWSPEYAWKRSDWEKWRDLYEAKHSVLTQSTYLWAHQIELKLNDQDSKNLRKSRETRSRYLNLMEILVSLWGSFFFRKAPNFSALKTLLETRLDNIDGQNTTFLSLIKDQSLRDFLLYGKTVILASNSPERARTLQDEREKGIKPFLKALSPLDVTDWAIENQDPARIGRFNLLRHEFNLVEPRLSSKDKPLVNRYCHEYRRGLSSVEVDIYKITLNLDGTIPNEFAVDTKNLSQKWELVGNSTLALEEIPAVQLTGESWLRDAAEECLRCFNLRSNRDNIQYMQGYASDYIIGVDPGNQALREAVGEYARMLLPEGASPVRLSPVPMGDYDKAVQDSIDLTFKVGLNLFRSIPADSRVGQSADTMNEEKDNPLALVESTLQDFENLFNGAMEHFAAFMGEAPPIEKIEFHKQVSEQSFNRFVMVVNGFRDYLKRSEKAEKEIAKRAVQYLEFEEEEAAEIEKEIDASKKEDPLQQSSRELLRGAINGNRSGTTQTQPPGNRGTSNGVSSEVR